MTGRDDNPAATQTDAELFRRTRRLREQFDSLRERIVEIYAGTSVNEGLAEIDAAVARERASHP